MPVTRALILTLISLLLAGPATAQDDPTTRDPWALARRLMNLEADFVIPELTPLYRPGATEHFWVGKTGANTPTRVTATLAASSLNIYQGLYLWVEDGLTYDPDAMNEMALQLNRILVTLRQRSVYGQPTIIPDVGQISDPSSLLRLPDVDNDSHLFVLYTQDLGNVQYVINANDLLPVPVAPYGFSNQHEMILVNTSVLPDAPLDNPAYVTVLTQAFYEFIMQANAADQDQWLKEALGTFLGRQLELPDIRPNAVTNFFQNPNTSLITPVSVTGNGANEGAQQVFLDYAAQRFGARLLQSLFLQPGRGLEPFDAALAAIDAVDPLTGRVATGDELFADFVAANVASYLADRLFGDTRYLHRTSLLPTDTPPAATILNNRLDADLPNQQVLPYGTQYYYVGSANPATFTLTFAGQPITPRLSLPAEDDPQNRFYWSGQAADRDVTLTRTVDLTGVETATLAFRIWFDVPLAQHYAYVEVSTDDGQTWEFLQTALSSTDDHFGLAYGPGYTGISSTAAPRPFPIIGVLLGGDGITVNEISAGGPASQTDLQAGDVIIGVDEEPWTSTPDVIALLATYEAGDTVNLYVQRGQDRLSIPVVLGAHPTRAKLPDPVWVEQHVDLSAYAGQVIQLRFEAISQPQGGGSGFVLDDIAIPEIKFHDDASGDTGWTSVGWQQMDNQVPQRYLVQYISSGTQDKPPRVRPLIGPGDDAAQGEWRFDIVPTEVMAFAISSLTGDTALPATFDLTLAAADS